MVSRSRIWGARRKALSGMEGLLDIVSLEMTTKSVGAGTLFTSWRERVPDFRSCNAEVASARWSMNKWNREQYAKPYHFVVLAWNAAEFMMAYDDRWRCRVQSTWSSMWPTPGRSVTARSANSSRPSQLSIRFPSLSATTWSTCVLSARTACLATTTDCRHVKAAKVWFSSDSCLESFTLTYYIRCESIKNKPL